MKEAWQKDVQMGVVKDTVDMVTAAIAAEVQEQPAPEAQESIVAESQEDTGEDILTAESIPRKRVDLLWVGGEEELELLETAAKAQSEIEVMLGPEQGGPKVFTVTREDIEWAKSLDKVVAKANEASARKDYATAIKYYEEALKIAPGTDLYLMSLGSGYAMSGQLDKGLQYLKRAHEISPNNQRITRNLQKLEQAIAYHS